MTSNEIQQVFDYEEEPVYFLHFWLKAVNDKSLLSLNVVLFLEGGYLVT